MRLATIRTGGTTRAVKADGDMLVDLGASDIGELLGRGGWAGRADRATVSTIVRLSPGDIIATGTPAGAGHTREPQRYLVGGETVVTEIEGLGRLGSRVAKASL
jgi:Fumarylacetoacetate (FAA) hydrolase family